MDFTSELKLFLNDNNEPLEKRLKIVHNAFNSIELQGSNKEEILLEWLSKSGIKTNTVEVWQTLLACLNSTNLQNYRQVNIKQTTLFHLVKVISKSLKKKVDIDIKQIIIDCALVVLRNECFKQYFKHDMELYSNLLSIVFKNLINVSDKLVLLNDQNIFNSKLFIKLENCNSFIENTLSVICDDIQDDNNEELIGATFNIVQKCIFQNNIKTFEEDLSKIFIKETLSETILETLFRKLIDIYNTSEKPHVFKIILKAFIQSYKSQPEVVFKFIVTLLQLVGFQYKDMFDIKLFECSLNHDSNKSFIIMADIFEIIHSTNVNLNTKINETTLDDFIKYNIVTILNTKPQLNEGILKILKATILLNPLIIENLITDIIYCVCIKREDNINSIYSDFMYSLFEMYFKLHRIHKFTSELLRTLKSVLSDDIQEREKIEDIITDVLEILPEKVIDYYHYCILLQSGKQVISIMRTLLTHLKDIVDNLSDYSKDSRKILYIQLLTKLICCFLSAVKIADYSTTENTLSKFCKDMEELKSILGNYGSSLLQLEHDHDLMYCFLNIAEYWGDMVILLKYYCSQLYSDYVKDLDNFMSDVSDYNTCKITHLHGYLSLEHWSLMSQRIKNFGEKPCQEIIQRLHFQKLRAFVLFNSTEKYLDNRSLIIKKTLIDVDDDWNLLFKEKFSIMILANADSTYLINGAEYLLKDLLKNENYQILNQYSVKNNRCLVQALVYIIFKKINHLFKTKRKHDEDSLTTPLSTTILKCLDPDMFIKNVNWNDTIQDAAKNFKDLDMNGSQTKVDVVKLEKLLKIFQHIPLCNLAEKCQAFIFLYLLSICIDLKKMSLEDQSCTNICESYLNGLVEGPKFPNISLYVSLDILIPTLVENITICKELNISILNKACRCEESSKSIKKLNKLLLKNLEDERYLEISSILLNSFTKANKYKLSQENKDYIKKCKENLCTHLIEFLKTNKKVNKVRLESYVLVTQYMLQKDWNDDTKEFLLLYEKYVNYAMKKFSKVNCEVSLHLFEMLLRHKSKIGIPEDFVLKTWAACKDIKNINENGLKQLIKTCALIFEIISVEQFATILDDLVNCTVAPLQEEKLEEFENYLNIWFCLLNSALSTAKQEIFLNSLVKLLQSVSFYIIKNKNTTILESIIKVQLNLIENKQIVLSGVMVDIHLQTVAILMSNSEDFIKTYKLSVSILEGLVQKRKYFITDRLPSFLIHLRILLNALCKQSSQDNCTDNSSIKSILDCGFMFEKLIRNIGYLKKDVARLVPYLISDILTNYENITLLQGVKNYLDNSIYLLLDLCDRHAVSYLYRVLSPASTELFKIIFDNYNKYHKFAGKI